MSQYSKTIFLICGMKAMWPFAGREEREALRRGFVVGGSLNGIVTVAVCKEGVLVAVEECAIVVVISEFEMVVSVGIQG